MKNWMIYQLQNLLCLKKNLFMTWACMKFTALEHRMFQMFYEETKTCVWKELCYKIWFHFLFQIHYSMHRKCAMQMYWLLAKNWSLIKNCKLIIPCYSFLSFSIREITIELPIKILYGLPLVQEYYIIFHCMWEKNRIIREINKH